MDTITGPFVRDSAGTGHAYQLRVMEEANPAGLALAEWVEALRATRNAREIDEDSSTLVYPPDTVRLGAERGLRLSFPCGDCLPYRVYVGRGTRIYSIGYSFDRSSYPGDRGLQEKLYEEVLSTLA